MRRSGIGVVLGAAVIAAAAGWMRSDEPVRATTIVVPAPPVLIEHVAPAVPPPVAPPPVAPPPPPAPKLAAPVVGTRCVDNVDTIGAPLTDEVLAATQPGVLDEAKALTMDDTGCAIAIALADELLVTWDGGQSFARYATGGRLDSVALAGARAVMLRDNRIGVVHAGDAAITWRGLDALAIPEDGATRNAAPSALRVAAAGPWTAVMRTHGAPAADAPTPADPPPAARLVGISDDDGATWRYTPTPPEADTLAVTDDGRLWLTRNEWNNNDAGPGLPVVHTFASDLAHTRWLADGALPARRGAAAYQYAFELDRFWGCGGTHKLVAYRGRRAITLESDRDTAGELVQNGVAAYAIYSGQLYRVRGLHSTPAASTLVHDTYIRDLLGVDRAGTLIAHHGDLLLRWSPRGGWRVLWSASTQP